MKIIATAAPGTADKYSTEIRLTEISFAEISFAEIKPVLVQVTTRAKRRRAPSKVAPPTGIPALHLRQARQALLIALYDSFVYNSFEAGNAGQQRQELEAETEAVQQLPLPSDPVASDPVASDPVQQAREFYDTELRPWMEELYNGQYIAIHPESRSYSVRQGYGKAFRALRMQQPLGPIIVHNIGFASSGLKARMREEQPQ